MAEDDERRIRREFARLVRELLGLDEPDRETDGRLEADE